MAIIGRFGSILNSCNSVIFRHIKVKLCMAFQRDVILKPVWFEKPSAKITFYVLLTQILRQYVHLHKHTLLSHLVLYLFFLNKKCKDINYKRV